MTKVYTLTIRAPTESDIGDNLIKTNLVSAELTLEFLRKWQRMPELTHYFVSRNELTNTCEYKYPNGAERAFAFMYLQPVPTGFNIEVRDIVEQ